VIVVVEALLLKPPVPLELAWELDAIPRRGRVPVAICQPETPFSAPVSRTPPEEARPAAFTVVSLLVLRVEKEDAREAEEVVSYRLRLSKLIREELDSPCV
jgi:hypothetical protein